MYSAFRKCCEQILRIPPAPEPPPGDETKTQLFRAAPNYYKYLLTIWALATAVIFLAIGSFMGIPLIAMTFSRHSEKGLIPLAIAMVFILLVIAVCRLFSLALVSLDFEKRWYLVTDRSLRVREGILQVREATVTFANIQNISISQGPIQRILGIADLRVDTAGGGGASAAKGHQQGPNLHTIWFRGVDNANQIRELMQLRLRQLKDSGLGDHEEMRAHAGVAVPANMLAALQEVYSEARALREAAARRGPAH